MRCISIINLNNKLYFTDTVLHRNVSCLGANFIAHLDQKLSKYYQIFGNLQNTHYVYHTN